MVSLSWWNRERPSSKLVRRLACRSLDSVIMKGCLLLETAGCALLKLRKPPRL
uniref:Uncharacterized protein n=1 Tax=Macaca fascicularis TaxID=9541 RepID=I7G368_MACFA|nr:unnamed protein product [Macaca fascicularis]